MTDEDRVELDRRLLEKYANLDSYLDNLDEERDRENVESELKEFSSDHSKKLRVEYQAALADLDSFDALRLLTPGNLAGALAGMVDFATMLSKITMKHTQMVSALHSDQLLRLETLVEIQGEMIAGLKARLEAIEASGPADE